MPVPGSCPSREEWQRLFNQPPPPGEAEPLAKHLERCATCATTVEAVLGQPTIVATPPAVAPGTSANNSAVQRVVARLRQGTPDTTGSYADDPESTQAAAASIAATTGILAPARGPDEIGWLGTYRVLKQLGAGGMGVVYLAEDSVLHRPVALKVMQPHFAASKHHRERFLREARSAAAIEHDHVVPIYEVGEDRGIPFLAMKLLQGESLESFLKRGATMTPAISARLGRQIALGLAAAHARGLIHRDIKPANVWLEKEPAGRVKLLDFGLARGSDSAQITGEGVIVGTPAYMSPEQARADTVDARSDLFSLGVVLYRVLTGKLPFLGKDAISTLVAVSMTTPAAVRSLNPDVPVAVEEVVTRLLEKDPALRPASAAATAKLLEAALRAPPVVQPVRAVAPVPDTPTEVVPVVAPLRVAPRRRAVRSRRPLWIGLAAAAILVTGVVVYVSMSDSESRPPDRRPGERRPDPPPARLSDEAWIAKVAALPVEEQAAEVAARLKELNPEFDGIFNSKIDGGAVVEFKINTDHVTDITPVQALKQLRSLSCEPARWDTGGGRLTSLEPLRGLPLDHLWCGGNPAVTDLGPLAGMKLVELVVYKAPITDLSPLKDMPLKKLGAWDTAVRDLAPLKGMRLHTLYLSRTPVVDLSPLRGMPLVNLDIPRLSAGDMSPLADAPLEVLWFEYCPWRDQELIRKPSLRIINRKLAQAFRQEAADQLVRFEAWCQAVAKLPPPQQAEAVAAKLRELNPGFKGGVGNFFNGDLAYGWEENHIVRIEVSTEQISDLSPLRALPSLRVARIEVRNFLQGVGTLTSLWPLRGLPLTEVYVSGNVDLSDLTPLAGMRLERLSVVRTSVDNLRVVKDMPLTQLWCRYTSINDLSPLAGKEIKGVFLTGAKVRDLTPLKGMKLETIHLEDIPATDLSVLADMPLVELNLTFEPTRDTALVRKPTLKTINGKPAMIFRRDLRIAEP
jgi:serine/threonine protein kinase